MVTTEYVKSALKPYKDEYFCDKCGKFIDKSERWNEYERPYSNGDFSFSDKIFVRYGGRPIKIYHASYEACLCEKCAEAFGSVVLSAISEFGINVKEVDTKKE